LEQAEEVALLVHLLFLTQLVQQVEAEGETLLALDYLEARAVAVAVTEVVAQALQAREVLAVLVQPTEVQVVAVKARWVQMQVVTLVVLVVLVQLY
jgi:hypothetical protein